ncbi:unnamed protein product [Caretta caretta]
MDPVPAAHPTLMSSRMSSPSLPITLGTDAEALQGSYKPLAAPAKAKHKLLWVATHSPRSTAPQPTEQQQFLHQHDISVAPEPDSPLLDMEDSLFEQQLSPPDLATFTDSENDMQQQAEFSPPDSPHHHRNLIKLKACSINI